MAFVVALPCGASIPHCSLESRSSWTPRGRLPRAHARSAPRRACRIVALDAVLFDCDGVLAETERDAHRVAFNMAFREKELDADWDAELYGELLKTGGGKERMTRFWNEVGWPAAYSNSEDQVSLVKGLHARKTELFMNLVKEGKVPLRDGVERLVSQALSSGTTVAVCSTSNEKAVSEIVALLGKESASQIRIFAGDVVEKKKPSPDIYNLAAAELSLDPARVCVIEDSHIGLTAAKAAGMKCIVTKSIYTADEDFAAADVVVQSLEDPVVTLDTVRKVVDSQ